MRSSHLHSSMRWPECLQWSVMYRRWLLRNLVTVAHMDRFSICSSCLDFWMGCSVLSAEITTCSQTFCLWLTSDMLWSVLPYLLLCTAIKMQHHLGVGTVIYPFLPFSSHSLFPLTGGSCSVSTELAWWSASDEQKWLIYSSMKIVSRICLFLVIWCILLHCTVCWPCV